MMHPLFGKKLNLDSNLYKNNTFAFRIDRVPSLIPKATWPALLTEIALACWLGGNIDRVEAPPILYFFPGF